jgi:hypothetical protein
MKANQLAAIVERMNAATPGPWHMAAHWPEMIFDAEGKGVAEASERGYHGDRYWMERGANASFIAHARQDIETLIEDHQRLWAAFQALIVTCGETPADIADL